MTNEYKVQELSDKIQLSRQAIYDKIEVGEFKTIERRLKGKKIKFVILTDKEYSGLVEQYGLRQSSQVENTLNGVNQVYSQPDEHESKEDESPANYDNTVNKILEFTEKYIQDFKNLSQENRELYSQVKLIEDKQKTAKEDSEYYKNQYFEIQQLLNESKKAQEETALKISALNKQIQELQTENARLKEKRIFGIKLGL
jgi:septal ring factor EnvC (AmiA/AmiB activator)